MAKGNLRRILKHEQLIESIEKSKSKPSPKRTHSSLDAITSEKIIEEPEEDTDKASREELLQEIQELKGKTLSKKEKRKLKKLEALLKDSSSSSEEENVLRSKDENGADDAETSGRGEVEDEDEEDSEEDSEEEPLDLERLAASQSESELDESSEKDDESSAEEGAGEQQEQESEAEEDDVPLSEVEYDLDADVVPHTKLTINNIAALKDSLARIRLPWEKHSFVEHQSVVGAEPTEEGIKDIYDDTERELAFYKQGMDAVKKGKVTLLKLKVPFSRPLDYFAEMAKSDEHMEKLKDKLLKEAADRKASEDAKRQRQLKKFGKQVQVSTLQERAKQKREALEKIKSLKKKRKNNELSNDDDFQIALEEATREDSHVEKRRKPNGKRLAKDAKYGFGGKKRGLKRNDANSSGDISAFSASKMKNKSRPGKSKRNRR